MEDKKIIVDPADFDVSLPYQMFTVLYSVPTAIDKISIKSWIVTGHKLSNSKGERTMTCILMSYPISIYVQQVEHTDIRSYERAGNVFFTNRESAIEYKKQTATEYYNNLIINLDKLQ